MKYMLDLKEIERKNIKKAKFVLPRLQTHLPIYLNPNQGLKKIMKNLPYLKQI